MELGELPFLLGSPIFLSFLFVAVFAVYKKNRKADSLSWTFIVLVSLFMALVSSLLLFAAGFVLFTHGGPFGRG